MTQVYDTGDAILSGSIAVMIAFPKSQQNWLYSAFLGALYNLGQAYAWREVGESTVDDTTLIFQDIFNNRITPVLIDVGDIKLSGSTAPPVGSWLLCDGSIYSQTTFPDLFTAIGTTYNSGGEGAGNFRVPDLRGRVPAVVNSGTTRLPSFADTLGGIGGEKEHVLLTAEMPAHTHTDAGHAHMYTSPILGLPSLTGAQPAAVPNPVPTITGTGYASINDTGGDGAHNNVQPTIALYAYILAEL